MDERVNLERVLRPIAEPAVGEAKPQTNHNWDGER